ncbi:MULTISPECIES: J domain-containing protein [Arthrobacter]|uniref:J domain-containing protein n=1 Tax=Arthrobacter terricola TaxID=2547396 RepID=A0A4R5K9K5_9MICC|nr:MULTISPECIES: DnaJ domain-containing protein [Arthrobacter]MBT8163229.1 J domain-containing protein [Arthrobacter sp. GN70]TDF91512.1 hypothetical protein E1809_20510 [Arthrobacter terricola]
MKNNDPDPYDILHLAPTATAREVARAYRALMRGAHPDTRPAREHHAGPGPTAPTSHEEPKMQEEPRLQDELQELRDIMAAYAILGNPEKRSAYDREHPRSAANPKPQQPDSAAVPPDSGASRADGETVRTPGALLPAASLLIGPVTWKPPGGRSPDMPARPGPFPPGGYTLILRIRH